MSTVNAVNAVFVTGTDTGIGKTIVTGLLGRYLLSMGYRVVTQKWIQTGNSDFSEDIELHLKLMKKKKEYIKDYISCINPYTFKFAASPHLAASLEKRKVNVNKIKSSFRFLLKEFDFIIVEGIGGALVPFTRNKLVIDIAGELDLPVLIVAGNKLGAINHTLLTIEAIRARNMKISGVVFNNLEENNNSVILKDNPEIVKALTGEKIHGVLPWLRNRESLYKAFIPVARSILPQLARKR